MPRAGSLGEMAQAMTHHSDIVRSSPVQADPVLATGPIGLGSGPSRYGLSGPPEKTAASGTVGGNLEMILFKSPSARNLFTVDFPECRIP